MLLDPASQETHAINVATVSSDEQWRLESGVILGCIYAKFGPVSGAFSEVKVMPNGEQVVYIPGAEFKKHLYTGFVLSGIGTLIWAFGASV